jgi:curved DNA-binding protein
MNYYEVLGVNSNASHDEIKKAYRDLVKIHHPDKGGSEDRFKQISEAYDILGDTNKRQEYDFKQSGDSSFRDFFVKFGGDWSGMFNQSFGQEARGLDVRISVPLTMSEVYNGCSKYIDLGGDSFNIKIPAGVLNGAKLKVNGKGDYHPINRSAPRGNAIITIQYIIDPDIIIQGHDIWTECTLSFVDLLLGTKINIKNSLYDITVNIPKNSYEGKVLRISGKGMPIYNTNEYGSLLIKLRTLPPNLNEEQLKLVEKIKELYA